jgi:alkylhydroperoxidase family enzyme
MTKFKIHTPDTAPEKSRRILRDIEGKLGFIPNGVAEMAESPTVLRAWNEVKSITEDGLLSPVERRVVGMTAAYLNDSTYCLAACTTIGAKEGVSRDVLEALRNDRPIKDGKLEALRIFTKSVMKRLGRPDTKDIETFKRAGYTNAHVLEVLLGISFSALGAYVNHIAETPLDEAFEENRIEGRAVGRAEGRKEGKTGKRKSA